MARTLPTRLDSHFPALAQLSDDERAVLSAFTLTRLYDKGGAIFSEGAPSRYLWFLESGRVRLYTAIVTLRA